MTKETAETIIKMEKKHYQKVSSEQKEKLCELVFQKRYRIKNAAEVLGIKYAAAKKIVKKFKEINIQKKNENMQEGRRCTYKPLTTTKTQIEILSYSSGELMKYQKSQQKL